MFNFFIGEMLASTYFKGNVRAFYNTIVGVNLHIFYSVGIESVDHVGV